MNGAQRVLAEILHRNPALKKRDLTRFLGVDRVYLTRARRTGGMGDAMLIRIHDLTGIPVLRLRDLRNCRRMPTLAPTPRERFEKWARKEGLYTRREGDTYFDPVVARLWRCWQAAKP